MQRRHFLTLVAGLAATKSFAAGNPLPAVSIVRPQMPPLDISGLLMTDVKGIRRNISDYSGQIVVLNLWASWCHPCRQEMPSLSRLASQTDSAKITVLPLAFDKKGPAPIKRFFDQTGITNLPILIGDAENMQAVLGWGLLPTTIVLNKSGQMIYIAKGGAIWDDSATIKWLNYLAS